MVRVYILTMSDSAYYDGAKDLTTDAVAAMLPRGYEVVGREVLPDEKDRIARRLAEISDNGLADLLLTTGGTGFAPRDNTPEATEAVVERKTWGISYYMMAESLKITPRAMVSRGISGIRKKTLILNLPGSPKGATENLSFVLPHLDHGLKLLKEEESDCAKMKEARK